MRLGRVACLLRHGRPFGVGAASFTFLITGSEFAGLLLATSVVLGQALPVVVVADRVIPASFLVAAAAATVMFAVTRRRGHAIVRVPELIEPLDLETLKLRTYAASAMTLGPAQPPSRTRQLLDEYSQSVALRAAGSSRGR